MKALIPAFLSKSSWNNITAVAAGSPINIGSVQTNDNSGDIKIRVLDKKFDVIESPITLTPGAATVLRLMLPPGDVAIIQGQAVDKKWNYYIAIEIEGGDDGLESPVLIGALPRN